MKLLPSSKLTLIQEAKWSSIIVIYSILRQFPMTTEYFLNRLPLCKHLYKQCNYRIMDSGWYIRGNHHTMHETSGSHSDTYFDFYFLDHHYPETRTKITEYINHLTMANKLKYSMWKCYVPKTFTKKLITLCFERKINLSLTLLACNT
jgi:hypothetical protein